MSRGPIGILGGTFNPVHFGHLRSALEMRELLQLAEVRLVPAAQPPHRPEPDCPAILRAEMVSLAVQGEGGLTCDPRELQRRGPSYTIDSLLELRAEEGAQTGIVLIIGTDALLKLDSWHRWRDLLDIAHVVAMARPGWSLPASGVVADWVEQFVSTDRDVLQRQPCGAVLIEQLRPLDISSTEIRAMVARGRSPRYLLPDSVWSRIQSAGLYGVAAEQ